jgi:hypothetical protein
MLRASIGLLVLGKVLLAVLSDVSLIRLRWVRFGSLIGIVTILWIGTVVLYPASPLTTSHREK